MSTDDLEERVKTIITILMQCEEASEAYIEAQAGFVGVTLWDLIKALSDALEAELQDRYGETPKIYPNMRRAFKRDMFLVDLARLLLEHTYDEKHQDETYKAGVAKEASEAAKSRVS